MLGFTVWVLQGFFRFCKGLLSGCTVLGTGRCDKGLGLIFSPDLTKAS